MPARKEIPVVDPQASWLRQAVTASDNKTIDPTFLCVVATVFVGLPFTFLSLVGITLIDVVINKQPFQPVSLGGGFAAVVSAIAAFIATAAALLKQDRNQQPKAPE